MKSIFWFALVLSLGGCVSRPARPDHPSPTVLREKLGFSEGEWTVVDSALASIVARRTDHRLAGEFVFTAAEYLRPGVVVVYVAEVFTHDLMPSYELRFHRIDGKWVQQQMILTEADRREGVFISGDRFHEMLRREDEKVRTELSLSQHEPTYVSRPFDPPRAPRLPSEVPRVIFSRLPAPDVWQRLLDSFDYCEDVFVIHTPQRTVVALKLSGEFRYVIQAAFDYTHTFIHTEMQKAAQPGATDNPDDAQRSREDH